MPGKYTTLRGKLPAFEEEPAYAAKIEERKRLVVDFTENPEAANVNWLAVRFAAARAEKQRLEDQIYDRNIEIEALSQLLVEALEVQSLEKVELSSGALVFIQDTPYPVVKDKAALLAWIKKQRMNDLLGVNYQTLKGLTNERLVAGQPPPPGVECFLKTQARLRGARNGGEE